MGLIQITIQMACNSDFVQYIVDQCSEAGNITVKKMFGDYGLYCDGIIVGLICDDNLFLKQTGLGRCLLKEAVLRQPYQGAKDHFHITDIDDREYLSELVKATFRELQVPVHRNRPDRH